MRDSEIRGYQNALRRELPALSIMERRGGGGQGVVFYAEDASEHPLAVKVLLSGPLSDAGQQARFEREVELLSRLHHEHIVPIKECGLAGGLPYYVMPYVDGRPIDDYCIVHDPPVRDCVKLFVQICDALAYAHSKGVIHRDIKPGNVMVNDSGHAYLLDFGLAHVADDGHSLTGPAHVIGTPGYMAPEQITGGDQSPDVRIDIYALGVVMYHLLGGRFPYDVDGGREAIYRNILTAEPLSLQSVQPAVGRDLSSIVHKCLEKDSLRRYRSADELSDDLKRWLAGEAVAARSDSRGYRLRKALYRHRWLLTGALIMVVLLVGGVVSTTLMWQRSERLAMTYRAGLEMGEMVKLGSVARDEGRTADAVYLWRHALLLSDAAPIRDEVVDRMRYEALHRLAELHFVDREPELAKEPCESAARIAEHYAGAYPEDEAWRRRLAFAEILRGRMLLAEKDYEGALAAFTRAADIRVGFAEGDPANDSLARHLATARSLQGRVCRKLGRMSESLAHYTEAYDIRLALHEADRKSADDAFRLANAEAKLGVWHIVQKTLDDDALALIWIERARSRLSNMQEGHMCDGRPRDCRRLATDLTKNRSLLERRQAAD